MKYQFIKIYLLFATIIIDIIVISFLLGSIPSTIGALKKLLYLNFQQSKLTGNYATNFLWCFIYIVTRITFSNDKIYALHCYVLV